MSSPDIKTESYFKSLQNLFSKNPNSEKAKLFRMYYGKIYENLPSHHDPIQINNIFFTEKYGQTYDAQEYFAKAEQKALIDDEIGNEDSVLSMSKTLLTLSEEFLKSNFPLYFLSKEFVQNATDADIDKNILFSDITLPFSSVFYILPKNMLVDWFSLTYIPESDDIILYTIYKNSELHMFLRNFLTSPNIEEKSRNSYDSIISFAIATLLFHKTGGFDQKTIPITPLPITKNRMGKIVIGERKRVSSNILNSPKISYRKKSDTENLNEPEEFQGYKQIPSHIRIIKDKKTGEIKIVSVSSSEVNPEKRREGVQFKKTKMTDNEIAELIKARKEDIISRMKSRGFSDDEINKFLIQKNLNESFFKKEITFKEYFLLKESQLTDKTKNFFLTLKSLLKDGSDFDYNIARGKQNAASVSFTYKEQKRVQVYYSLWFYGKENLKNNNVQNITVQIYKTDFNNNIIHRIAKNNFYNKRTETLTFNPVLKTETEFAEYIKSVLERSEHDGYF